MHVSWNNGYKNTRQASCWKVCVRARNIYLDSGSDLKHWPVPDSIWSESTKCLLIYQETPVLMVYLLSFCVLSPWPLTWFEWSLSNRKAFKSEHWGGDNILSFLWIFHFIPAEAKHIMKVKSQSLWVWTEEYVSMSICNSTTASMGALSALHSVHSDISRSIRRIKWPAEVLCLESYSFLRPSNYLGLFASRW